MSHPQVDLDVSLGALPFEVDLVGRAVSKRINGVAFRVATAEDVVVMKSLALRPRDIADIEGILDAVPSLAIERIRRDVRALAELADGPDFLGELDRIVAAQGRKASRAPRAQKRKQKKQRRNASRPRMRLDQDLAAGGREPNEEHGERPRYLHRVDPNQAPHTPASRLQVNPSKKSISFGPQESLSAQV